MAEFARMAAPIVRLDYESIDENATPRLPAGNISGGLGGTIAGCTCQFPANEGPVSTWRGKKLAVRNSILTLVRQRAYNYT
jgi:hypothetical protein